MAAIVGPTAVGKSAVAVGVAARLNGEIISLDSRQIYRHMPIGTAQPGERDRKGISHHLYGIRDPGQSISAGEYVHLVEKTVKDILERKSLPIVCGGSGLYYRALTRGLFEESRSDPDVRVNLRRELAEKGAVELLARLHKIDPEYARIVHANNHKRLLRALEIYQTTGRPPSDHFRLQKQKSSPFRYVTAYLRADLDFLKKRIQGRTESMLKAGWIEEVRTLLREGYDPAQAPMDSLGYREIIHHLEGGSRYDEMVERINISTRQYARKQMKWFDREPVEFRMDMSGTTPVESVVDRVVRLLKKNLTA